MTRYKGGLKPQDQGTNKTCYAYAISRMVLNLIKKLKIITNIDINTITEVNDLNKIENKYMNTTLPQVKHFLSINGMVNDDDFITKKTELLQKYNTKKTEQIIKEKEIDEISKKNRIIFNTLSFVNKNTNILVGLNDLTKKVISEIKDNKAENEQNKNYSSELNTDNINILTCIINILDKQHQLRVDEVKSKIDNILDDKYDNPFMKITTGYQLKI